MIVQRISPFLDPIDVHPGALIELMIKLFLLTLVIRDSPRVNCHLGIGACSSALRQSAWIDHKNAIDNLGR